MNFNLTSLFHCRQSVSSDTYYHANDLRKIRYSSTSLLGLSGLPLFYAYSQCRPHDIRLMFNREIVLLCCHPIIYMCYQMVGQCSNNVQASRKNVGEILHILVFPLTISDAIFCKSIYGHMIPDCGRCLLWYSCFSCDSQVNPHVNINLET